MNRTASRRLAALDGLVSPAVGERLYELAREVPADQFIVEIGSYRGKSSCYLGEGARDGYGARVHCVDPWDLPGNPTGRHGFAESETFEIWKRQVAAMGLTGKVTPHRAYAHDYVRQWRRRPIGLLFIDGSHKYADVRQDFEDWSPFVMPAGVVAFDDYGGRNVGVTRFVNELAVSGRNFDVGTPPLAIVRLM